MHKRFEELKLSGNLPSPSGVGLAILRQTQGDDASFDDLIRSLQADPALTGRILKLANSARVAGVEPVATVRQAAMRLGVRSVRSVALGFTLVSSNRSGACEAFDYDRYWSASLACAVAAQSLTRRARVCEASEAFTCGLLSRVGMLALASVHPDLYGGLLVECADKPLATLLAAETRTFEINQWEVTASMMAEWGLPELFSAAIRSFAKPPEPAEDERVQSMIAILDSAARLADWLLGDAAADAAQRARDWNALAIAARACFIDEDELHEVCAEAAQEWHEWGDTFRIPTLEANWSSDSSAIPESLFQTKTQAQMAFDGAASAIGAADDIARVAPASIRILVVDDDARLVRLLEHHLTSAGYTVSSAADGKAGLKRALDEAPDIVLTDWLMPELSGLELCQELRSRQMEHRPYIVMLTAREDEDRIVDAFNAGADDYVTKPFNPRLMLARVNAGQRLIALQRKVEADKRVRIDQFADMGRMTRKLRAAALTDILTDLPNRRSGMLRLEQDWMTAVRTDHPLAVVIIDIDHFKQINDRHGHDIGDVVLKSTADALRLHTRKSDFLCRLGGEEFLVVSLNTDAASAHAVAERLRAAVEANRIHGAGYDGQVTISLGLAVKHAGMRNADELLKGADRAVYEAKRAGRNRIGGDPIGGDAAGRRLLESA